MTKTVVKKHIVTSIHNLSSDLQDKLKELYAHGFSDAMIRIDKPNGDFFYAVPLETEDTSYMVKIDVKIDDHADEDDDKEYYDDDINGADDISDTADASNDSDDDGDGVM